MDNQAADHIRGRYDYFFAIALPSAFLVVQEMKNAPSRPCKKNELSDI